MYFVNLLSRNDTDHYAPLFEIIYVTELVFILLTYIAAPLVIYSALKVARLHNVIRLRLIFPMLIACAHLTTRIMIMHHQYFGPFEYVVTVPLIVGSVMREFFLAYMTALVAFLALDRWVATKAWAWYENGGASTILFFAALEATLMIISSIVAFMVVWEFITDIQVVFYFGVVVFAGSLLFALVFRHNLHEMEEMKRGAVIHRYSVARTYQIKENIMLLTAFSKVTRPLVAACLPPFIFFPMFVFIPPNIGYDGLRFFSASMYDLWLSIASFVVIGYIPFCYADMQKPLINRVLRTTVKPEITVSTSAESSNIYFKFLLNDLRKESN